LVGLALTIAQTTPQAQQQVVNTVNGFNQTIAPQLNNLISQTSSPVLMPIYSNTVQTGTAIIQAAPPLGGRYAGSFSGEQLFIAGFCSLARSPLDFVVANYDPASGSSTITTSAPGAGSGTLSSDGSASFTINGVAGPDVSCTFNGTFTPDASGGVSAMGSWSCMPGMPTPSGFKKDEGMWSASHQ
jgi:hypothetical protein